MSHSRLEELQAEVERLLGIIDAPRTYEWVTYDAPRGDATPYIAYEDGQYHYIISERGVENTRISSALRDDIVYALLSDVTFSMASSFAAGKENYRATLFARQRELFEQLNPAWAEKCKQEIAAILAQHPL